MFRERKKSVTKKGNYCTSSMAQLTEFIVSEVGQRNDTHNIS